MLRGRHHPSHKGGSTRKIILNVAVSLDGFIEGPKGEIDWCFVDQDYGMKSFMKRIDAIFMGRKSYELVMKMEGKNPYKKFTTYVFSTTLKEKEGIVLIDGDMRIEVERIKRMRGKDIWLFGGANLITSFMNLNLVDELQLSIHPVLLGRGKPLFEAVNNRAYYSLKDSRTYSTGLVQVFYERTKQTPGAN
ncbi:MAG: dihydrofolate reductase family protein [Bacteroidota bacterium]